MSRDPAAGRSDAEIISHRRKDTGKRCRTQVGMIDLIGNKENVPQACVLHLSRVKKTFRTVISDGA